MGKQLAVGVSLFILSVSSLSAANAPEIRTMAGADFSPYVSYAWAPKKDMPDGHPLTNGSDLDVEIKSAADRELMGSGYQRTGPDGDPSLMINYVWIDADRLEVSGTTIGSGSVKWIGDPATHESRSYREGTLVFEAVDTKSQEMVWSGWITELASTSEKLESKAPKATSKIFRHFPTK